MLRAAGEVGVVVASAVVVALAVRVFLVQAFAISSPLMEGTLVTGDRVLVSKLVPEVIGLQRGDIVVVEGPGGWLPPPTGSGRTSLGGVLHDVLTGLGVLAEDAGGYLVKRVIGLPGDSVMCCDGDGRIKVNGMPIDEPYLFPGDLPSDQLFSETVPDGRLWLMGDHRAVAEDSDTGWGLDQEAVPVDRVIGTAFVIVWPLNRAWWLTVPDSTFAQVPDPPAS